jgi:hypothetical protein
MFEYRFQIFVKKRVTRGTCKRGNGGRPLRGSAVFLLQIFAARLQVELARPGDDVLPTFLHEGLHHRV